MQNQWTSQISSGSAVVIEVPIGGRRLIVVELVESDPTVGSVNDLGNIGINTVGGVPFNLKTGHIGVQNSLIWLGDVPVADPMVLRAVFAAPPSGAICTVRWVTLASTEVGGGMGSGPNVVQTYPLGMPKVALLTGTVDVLTLALRPPAGYQWLIQYAVGYHDDTASRGIAWAWTDGVTTVNIGVVQSSASTVRWPLSLHHTGAAVVSGQVHGLLATRAVYPTFTVDALTSGKKLLVGYSVLEFAGGA